MRLYRQRYVPMCHGWIVATSFFRQQEIRQIGYIARWPWTIYRGWPFCMYTLRQRVYETPAALWRRSPCCRQGSSFLTTARDSILAKWVSMGLWARFHENDWATDSPCTNHAACSTQWCMDISLNRIYKRFTRGHRLAETVNWKLSQYNLIIAYTALV